MESWLSRGLAAWVAAVGRHARAVVVGAAVASVALVAYAALTLGINTRHTALLSEDLPFWQQYKAFEALFPIVDEALLVVIDADTSGAARDAARALADRLAEHPELYQSVYLPGGGDFFERHALLYLEVGELEDLADQIAGVQPLLAQVSQDRSLKALAGALEAGIEQMGSDPDTPVDLTPAFDSMSLAVRAVLEGNPHPISWTELLLRRKLPGESSRQLVVLQPVYDYDRILPGIRVMQQVRDTARELGLTPEHGVQVRITGNVALNTEEMLAVARSVILAALVSFAIVAAILFFAMRSVRLVAWVLVTLLVGLSWTAAFAAATVGQVNVVSVAFAVLFIGLGVDFGIHFAMRYAELAREDGNEHALDAAVRSVGGSLVLCGFTTAMGFFVFVPTDYRAVAELGLVSGTGMLISLACTLTLLPALLVLWPPQPAQVQGGVPWLERTLVTVSAHHPGTIRLVAAALALVSLGVLPFARFDHNVVDLRDPSTESVQAFDDLLSDSETSPWTIDVMEESLESAQAEALRLRELEVVERAVTLADYVPDDQEAKLAILADLGYLLPPPPADGLPPQVPLAEQIEALRTLQLALESPWLTSDPQRGESARRAAASLARFLARLETLERKQEALDRFEASLTGALPGQLRLLWRALEPETISLESLPDDLRRRMVAADGRARIEVLPTEDISDNEAHARFVDTVRAEAPSATGSAVTLLEWGRAVVRTFRQALGMATLAIALLLWLLWRRLSDMALVLVPLALAATTTVAIAVLMGMSFNFGNVVVLPLLLGIGVDSGIHLVHRHRAALEEGRAGAPERELLETSTPQAVFFSALTTMASFGSLALSGHVGFASMGQLLLIGVVVMLAANLVVLPALLALRGPEGEAETGAQPARASHPR